MATNLLAGDGHRNGSVRQRKQIKTRVMGEGKFTKRSKQTVQLLDQTEPSKQFKGVR